MLYVGYLFVGFLCVLCIGGMSVGTRKPFPLFEAAFAFILWPLWLLLLLCVFAFFFFVGFGARMKARG